MARALVYLSTGDRASLADLPLTSRMCETAELRGCWLFHVPLCVNMLPRNRVISVMHDNLLRTATHANASGRNRAAVFISTREQG